MGRIKDLLQKWSKEVKEEETLMTASQQNPAVGTITLNPINGNASIVTGIHGTTYATGTTTTYTYNPTTWQSTIFSPAATSDILTISNHSGKELVRLTHEGKVVWADPEMNEEEAAQAFGRALSYSAELKAGITKQVKATMRDNIFEEIINIAKTKGSLTVDELTYMYEASKIMEKLKGGN